MSEQFDAAIRAHFGVGEEYVVGVSTEGGGEVQIGDMTWDTVPLTFVMTAYVPGGGKKSKSYSETFDSLPEVWDALIPKEG